MRPIGMAVGNGVRLQILSTPTRCQRRMRPDVRGRRRRHLARRLRERRRRLGRSARVDVRPIRTGPVELMRMLMRMLMRLVHRGQVVPLSKLLQPGSTVDRGIVLRTPYGVGEEARLLPDHLVRDRPTGSLGVSRPIRQGSLEVGKTTLGRPHGRPTTLIGKEIFLLVSENLGDGADSESASNAIGDRRPK